MNVLWAEAEKGNTYTDEQLADVWAAAYNAATNAKELVTEIFSVAGTAALYTKFRFERIHRDIHGVLQHGIVQPHWMNLAGMAYVGLTLQHQCSVPSKGNGKKILWDIVVVFLDV